MDLATIIGIIGAFIIVVAAMVLGGGVGVFVNVPSLLVVLGGSLFVVLSKFNLSEFLGAVKIAIKAFSCKVESPEAVISRSVELADAARKGGLLSLEEMEVPNPFMKKGIQYLVDGIEPEVVRTTLMKDMTQTVDRHEKGQKIFTALADVAPAMGMIGTLIGLVQMLSAMDDPKAIGPAMAVALLTTLYGAIIANMVANPIADKLALRSQEEEKIRKLIIDSLIGIQNGQNPRVIDEMLQVYLPAAQRTAGAEDG